VMARSATTRYVLCLCGSTGAIAGGRSSGRTSGSTGWATATVAYLAAGCLLLQHVQHGLHVCFKGWEGAGRSAKPQFVVHLRADSDKQPQSFSYGSIRVCLNQRAINVLTCCLGCVMWAGGVARTSTNCHVMSLVDACVLLAKRQAGIWCLLLISSHWVPDSQSCFSAGEHQLLCNLCACRKSQHVLHLLRQLRPQVLRCVCMCAAGD